MVTMRYTMKLACSCQISTIVVTWAILKIVGAQWSKQDERTPRPMDVRSAHWHVTQLKLRQ